MAADLGFVADAAEGGARELATHAARDRATEGGLADAGRADEAEDRRLGVRGELAHGEELEDPVLHLAQAVVVRVEDLARLREIEMVLGLLVPGQLEQPVEIGPDQMAIGGVLGQRRESLQLALGEGLGLGGQLGAVELSRSSSISRAPASVSPISFWISRMR